MYAAREALRHVFQFELLKGGSWGIAGYRALETGICWSLGHGVSVSVEGSVRCGRMHNGLFPPISWRCK